MYAIMLGQCFLCERTILFNPHKVPSVMDEHGKKQPTCARCIEAANVLRAERGLPPWAPPLPGAYDAIPAEEL